MSDEIPLMSIQFSEFSEEEDGNLYFSGIALESGVWTDAHGQTAFYPVEVIQAAAESFVGLKILCEHKLGSVGEILETEVTDFGFKISKGVLRHPASIDAVKNGEKKGLSVGAAIRVDPVRRVALEIVKPEEVSLVASPACRTCMLDRDEIKDEVSMAENDIDSPVVDIEDARAKEICEQYIDDPEKYHACKNYFEAITTLAKAEAEWRLRFSPTEGETHMSEEIKTEEIVEETIITEEPVVEAEPVEAELAEAEVEEAESEVEEVTEEPVEEVVEEVTEEAELSEEPVEEAPVVEEEAKDVVEEEPVEVVEEEDPTVELSAEIATLKEQLESTKVDLAAATAELSILRAEHADLVEEKHNGLVEAVMAADPNADSKFIDNMGDAELTMYLSTVERLKSQKPTLGTERKSVTKDETVNLSAEPEEKKEITGREATRLFAESLRMK